MSKQLEPHFVKLRVGDRFVPYATSRIGDEFIPVKFEHWHAANDFANSPDIVGNYLVEIHPFYPEYADLERRSLDRDIEALREDLRKIAEKVEEEITALNAKRDLIP
jgi:hypothetical protein